MKQTPLTNGFTDWIDFGSPFYHTSKVRITKRKYKLIKQPNETQVQSNTTNEVY